MVNEALHALPFRGTGAKARRLPFAARLSSLSSWELDVAQAAAIEAAGVVAGYNLKPEIYFTGARADFVARLPGDPDAAILEVGCGSGGTGALALASGKAGRYVGVELFPSAAAEARRVLSEVIEGDVETIALPFARASFDVLILSEVLEHLRDPWAAVGRLAPLVKTGGLVLASSPNIAHWRIVLALAAGRFEHTGMGPMDRTHLRWFTPSTFRGLFEGAGFAVEHVGPVTPFAARTRLLSRLSGGRTDHLFMRQIALLGRKR
jgi:SAM-dependent methyltransferase